MRVFIADRFDPGGREELQRLGCQLEYQPDTTAETLGQTLAEADPDVLVVRSTKVSADAQKKGTRLKLIIRAGAGTDTIDVAHASASGIFVANCPAKNAAAVAELAWAHILGCDRRLYDQCRELRGARWNKKEYARARGLKGRTLGIVGLGTIAREVALRGKAFGMEIVAWSRSLSEERAAEAGVERAETPLEVARRADVVSVHVASTPETRHLVDRAFVEALREGAILVNTSRGAVVDEQALQWGVENKGLRVGLDVFQNEPGSGTGTFESAIAMHEGVYGTHHVGASTEQAQQAIADEAVRVVREFKATGSAPNCINLAERSRATCQLLVRHQNRPGVLAQVLRLISEQGVNVEEMENILYRGSAAACARIRLSQEPGEDLVQKLSESSEHILGIELNPISISKQETDS